MKHFLLSEKEESFVAKRLLVKVNEADNVAIAVKEIKAGTQVSEDLVTRQDIPQAHKVEMCIRDRYGAGRVMSVFQLQYLKYRNVLLQRV